MAWRILIVEDSEFTREALQGLLAAQGHRVVAAASGRAALEAAAAEDFDLALVDLALPDISGLDLVDALRAARAAPPRLVAMSADDAAGPRALDSGFDDFVSKPLRPEGIAALLERNLGGARDWSRALRAVRGSRRLLGRMAEVFLEEAPRLLDDLRRAFADEDAEAFHRAAHTLKGALGYFDAPRADVVLEHFLHEGDEPDWAALRPDLATLERALERILLEVERLARQHGDERDDRPAAGG